MSPTLEYINNGREGHVAYKDGHGDLKLYFEFGGGRRIAIIHVPTTNDWTTKFKRPLADRKLILTYVAEQIIKDQAPNGFYELSDSYIEIFS